MRTLNVLSIDMDWIMEPCINLYNDMVKVINEEILWTHINKVRQIDNHLSFNEEHLKNVFSVFTRALFTMPFKKNVWFVENHDAVLFQLAHERFFQNFQFNIANIDHHHDINYGQSQIDEVDKYNAVRLGSWVWYLDKYHLLNKYVWIRNENSDLYRGPKMRAEYIHSPNISAIDDLTFDMVFVVKSPHWFPQRYHIYFDMFRKLYENYTGNPANIDERFFCPFGKSQQYPYRGD